MAIGGDGTLNEVVNGLVIEGMVNPTVNLGIIPGGTGSDSVRTLGIPHDYRTACHCLLRGKPHCIDQGLITRVSEGRKVQRFFPNVAGLGFDGEIAERANRSSKALGGTLPFLSSLFVKLLKNFSAKDERQASVDAFIVVNDQDARLVHRASSPRAEWLVADQ